GDDAHETEEEGQPDEAPELAAGALPDLGEADLAPEDRLAHRDDRQPLEDERGETDRQRAEEEADEGADAEEGVEIRDARLRGPLDPPEHRDGEAGLDDGAHADDDDRQSEHHHGVAADGAEGAVVDLPEGERAEGDDPRLDGRGDRDEPAGAVVAAPAWCLPVLPVLPVLRLAAVRLRPVLAVLAVLVGSGLRPVLAVLLADGLRAVGAVPWTGRDRLGAVLAVLAVLVRTRHG